jgi:hypothetical protein
MSYAFVRHSAVAAGLFALFVFWPHAAALAQQPAEAAPSAPLTLDPNLLKLPAPGSDFDKPSTARPQDDTSAKLDLPDHIDLGTSQLRFDTSRKTVDSVPLVGIDAADPKVLNPRLPHENASPLKPDYFGFTLSTPTH